jgi:hypothetical protein
MKINRDLCIITWFSMQCSYLGFFPLMNIPYNITMMAILLLVSRIVITSFVVPGYDDRLLKEIPSFMLYRCMIVGDSNNCEQAIQLISSEYIQVKNLTSFS